MSIHGLNPCHNFSKYSCGISTQKLITMAQSQVTHRVLNILLYPNLFYPSPFFQAKNLFDSCIDLDKRNVYGQQFFKMLLSDSNSFGGYPIIYPMWQKGSLTREDLLVEFGDTLFFSLKYNEGKKEIEVKEKYIEMPSIDRVVLLKTTYYFIKIMNTEQSFSKVLEAINSMYNFKEKFDKGNILEEKYYLKPLAQINWAYVFQKVSKKYGLSVEQFTLNPHYFTKLSYLLTSASIETLSNICHWYQRVIHYVDDGPNELQVLLKNNVGHQTVDQDVWYQCTEFMMQSMLSYPILYVYALKYFDMESISKIKKMISEIKYVFRNLIINNTMAEIGLKNSALKKLDSLKIIFRFPHWISHLNQSLFFYKDILPISKNNFLENKWKMNLFQRKELIKNNIDAKLSPFLIDFQYSVLLNEIYLNIPYIEILFNSNGPGFFNYGALGTTIAHEVSHAFDLFGRRLNKLKGKNMVEITQRNTLHCINDQLKLFYAKVLNITLLSSHYYLSINENYADNLGLQIGFKAYQNSLSYVHDSFFRGEEVCKKFFFISYAQKFCGTEEENIVHPPYAFRSLVPLWNSNDFLLLFNCSKSDLLFKNCSII